jgi:CheY-like chemotaxis protein
MVRPERRILEPTSRGPVLIVDDASDTCDAIIAVLESEGYRAVSANDGRQALHDLRGEDTPCMVLLDLMMPGTTGWDFRREQLDDPHLAEIPVVICSAVSNVELQAARLGVSDVIGKPIDPDQLLAIVARYAGPPRRDSFGAP